MKLHLSQIHNNTEAYKSDNSHFDNLLESGGYLVERWIRGCAAQIGCFFGLSGLPMAPFLFDNWFRYRSHFCKIHNFQ